MAKKKPQVDDVNADTIEVTLESEQPEPESDVEPEAAQADDLQTALRAELEHVNQELAEMRESYLRSVAEIDNLRKRNAAELDKARKFAIDRFAKSLLEVVESLDKACEMDFSEDVAPVIEGVELTRKQLMNVLERESIQQIIPAPGDAFDVNQHEAMTMVPTEHMPPNHIVEVFRPGYMIHDRLLRAAMVIVSAKAPQAESEAPDAQSADDLIEDA